MGGGGVLALDYLASAVFTALVFNKYGEWRKQWPVTLITIFSWYFSFLIIMILPIDISSSYYWECIRCWKCGATANITKFYGFEDNGIEKCQKEERCQADFSTVDAIGLSYSELKKECDADSTCACPVPWSYSDREDLVNTWLASYIIAQLLTWLILPIMTSFYMSGELKFMRKLRESIYVNSVFYGIILIVTILAIIILAAQKKLDNFGALCAALANGFGVIVIIVMLGYGLVEVPRISYKKSRASAKLKLYYFKVARHQSEMHEAKSDYNRLVREVKSLSKHPWSRDLRPFVDDIMRKLPELQTVKEESVDIKKNKSNDMSFTRKTLVALNANVNAVVQTRNRTIAQWTNAVNTVIDLENLQNNMSSPTRTWTNVSGEEETIFFFGSYWPKVQWIWFCKIRPNLYFMLALVCAGASVILLWSEVLASSDDPVLSVYSVAINSAGRKGDYFGVEVLVFISLVYLGLCSYFVVFKLRFFDFYYMVTHKQTDALSLMLSSNLLTRLTAPMLLNFITLAHLDKSLFDSHVVIQQPTAFSEVVGDMSGPNTKWLVGLSKFFPIALIFFCIATYFNFWPMLATMLGQQSYIEEDDMSNDMIEEGKTYVDREKRKMARRNRFKLAYGNKWGGEEGRDIEEGEVDATAIASVVPRSRTGLLSESYRSESIENQNKTTVVVAGKNRRAKQNPYDSFANDDYSSEAIDYDPSAPLSMGSRRSETTNKAISKNTNSNRGRIFDGF